MESDTGVVTMTDIKQAAVSISAALLKREACYSDTDQRLDKSLIYYTNAIIAKVRKEGHDQESIQSSTTPDPKVTKTEENITLKRANRLALSQQVTRRLQGTGKTV